MKARDLSGLYSDLLIMNAESGMGFSYGIFKKDISIDEVKKFLSSSMICVMRNSHGEKAGFFYNYLIPVSGTAEQLSHQGLVVIYKNSGVDLITAPYAYANYLMHEFLNGNFYVSNISAVPLIIGSFSEIFDDVWPSIKAKNIRLSLPGYKKVLMALEENYIKPFFEESVVSYSRFILNSPIEKMGFNSNIRELPRHEKLMHNLFTSNWIDPSKGEDMIQIGRVTTATLSKLERMFRDIHIAA